MKIVAVDIESTGLSPYKDSIIEIGAVKVCDGKIEDGFKTYVRYDFPLNERIVALTGIRNEDLLGAPCEGDAVRSFMEFMGECDVIIGHNVAFDYGFLYMAAKRAGIGFGPRIVDTLEISRTLHPELESRKLGDMCVYYGIESENWHRAYDDALAAYRVYEKLKEEAGLGDEGVFSPKEYVFKEKKTEPATERQKKYLIDLLKYHKINATVDLENLTKSEASRLIDKIASCKSIAKACESGIPRKGSGF